MEAFNMAKIKYDGVIEGVRYSSAGQIEMVRIYEKRGFVFSDSILMDRAGLAEKLSQGRQFVTGHRKPYVANMFETGKLVRLACGDNPTISTKVPAGSQDFLANVPIF
jgi:hypothetical protein